MYNLTTGCCGPQTGRSGPWAKPDCPFDGVYLAHYTAENGPAWKGDKLGNQVFHQARDGSFWVDALDQIVHFRYRPSGAEPETLIEPAVDCVSSAGNILLRWSGRDLWDRTPPDKRHYQWRRQP